jgi:NADPH:quinone reductase-like Zn-dependent oxidoreductase
LPSAPAGQAHSALDSLGLVKPGGTVCVVGRFSHDWVIEAFEMVAVIPSGAKLTTFHSEDLKGAAGRAPLAHIVRGDYHANLDMVFTLDRIADAHRYMEAPGDRQGRDPSLVGFHPP